MAKLPSETTIVLNLDTSRVEAKLDKLYARLVELREEALAIREIQAGFEKEVNEVLAEIERLEVNRRDKN